jgi:hypothetical protein
MRRGVSLTISVVALWAATSPLVAAAGAAPRVSPTSCRAEQMTVSVKAVAMKPPNASTAWYGRVVYTNTGRDCMLAASTVTVLADTGGAGSPRALTKPSVPVARGSHFVVAHGGSAHAWLLVRDLQPKNWIPIVCPPTAIDGLMVGGPSRTWPLKYFALSPAAGVCFAYIIKASSGVVAPGT